MSRRTAVAAALLTLLTGTVATAGCGSDDAVPPPPTTTIAETTSVPETTPTAEATTQAPLGPYAPTEKPTSVVSPSPGPVGAACVTEADNAEIAHVKVMQDAGGPNLTGAEITTATIGHGKAGVVLVHQSNGDLCQWWPYARTLAKAGYLVMSVDLEGFGSSGYGQYEGVQPAPYGLDVASAVSALRSMGASRVVVIGASMGGTSALAGAALARPPVNGVISLSAPAFYNEMDARSAVRRLTMPVLYAVGADDGDFAADAKTLRAATKAPAQLIVVPGSAHGVALVEEGGQTTVRRAVATFLANYAR